MALRDDFDLIQIQTQSQNKKEKVERLKKIGSLESYKVDEEKIKKQDAILREYNLL